MAPADAIRRPELGSLSVGAEADIAVIEERRGRFGYVDCGMIRGPGGTPVRGPRMRSRLTGDRKLEARLTLRAGAIVYDSDGLRLPDYGDVHASP